MKKRLSLCIAVMLIMAICFSACGNNATSSSSVSSGNKTSETTKANADENQVTKLPLQSNQDYTPLTSDDYKVFDECISDITEIAKGASNNADALNKVNEKAESLKNEGKVSVVNKHDSYVYIEFKSGIRYVYYLQNPETSTVGSDVKVTVTSMQPFKTEFASRNKETETADKKATDDSAEKIANAYENYTWSINLDDSAVTFQKVVDTFVSNSVILWSGHGGYTNEFGCFLALSITKKDLKIDDPDLACFGNDGNYLITPEFIKKYVGNMSNSFVYLSTCCGLKDNSLCSVLQSKGASAIVANTDVINTIYTSNMMSAVVDHLLEGNNLDAAMAAAKKTYGAQDPNTYPEQGSAGHAVPTVFCGGDYKFAENDSAENDLADGKYHTMSLLAGGEGLDPNKTSVCTSAVIKDGYLIITASFYKLDNMGSPTGELIPNKERHIKLSNEALIITPVFRQTVEQYLNRVESGEIAAPDLSVEIKNGEVVSCSLYA